MAPEHHRLFRPLRGRPNKQKKSSIARKPKSPLKYQDLNFFAVSKFCISESLDFFLFPPLQKGSQKLSFCGRPNSKQIMQNGGFKYLTSKKEEINLHMREEKKRQCEKKVFLHAKVVKNRVQ